MINTLPQPGLGGFTPAYIDSLRKIVDGLIARVPVERGRVVASILENDSEWQHVKRQTGYLRNSANKAQLDLILNTTPENWYNYNVLQRLYDWYWLACAEMVIARREGLTASADDGIEEVIE